MARAARRRTTAMEILGAGWGHPAAARARGALVALFGLSLILAMATWNASDPSLNVSSPLPPKNIFGSYGSTAADIGMQSLGLAAWLVALLMVMSGFGRAAERQPHMARTHRRMRAGAGLLGALAFAGLLASLAPPAAWPLSKGLGGFWGDGLLNLAVGGFSALQLPQPMAVSAALCGLVATVSLAFALGVKRSDFAVAGAWLGDLFRPRPRLAPKGPRVASRRRAEAGPLDMPGPQIPDDAEQAPPQVLGTKAPRQSPREARENQKTLPFAEPKGFRLPEIAMLHKGKPRASAVDEEALRQNARLLESVLVEFGINGKIDQIRPGPVVTLYELVPAAGVKSARVVALSDDIARSMSVAACRVSVVPGRNAIGIELPNHRRETVYLRDLLASTEYEKTSHVLPMALGETIGGDPYIADLARMPHLLIAGTTGSGKSVGVNAMILSILYRLAPHQCRMIMIDPKMLELSVYDGIPHLLAPVVTDPKKAIVALKWTVREMEGRYRLMSKIGVRNVAGYNERAAELRAKGEHFVRTVQTGFDEGGRPMYEEERIDPEPMPYLVVIIDEVADLMMVAGKDIEGAVQRLAQMARAAGIHLIMATQRPSVDVITGTIKANFPTRISFQVTSRIDARTILGEQGAEQLLGQGDMLYMAGGGRVTRLHGPFVSDAEVEEVTRFLRAQGTPDYLDDVTAAPDEDDEDGAGMGGG